MYEVCYKNDSLVGEASALRPAGLRETLIDKQFLQFLHLIITSAFLELLFDNLAINSGLVESQARLSQIGHLYSIIFSPFCQFAELRTHTVK